jgi:outer membrane protein OmpA-like peptidoglycan-associated protein
MAKIYNSIMSLIKPGRIATAAATLEENEHKVSAATDIILPSILACMLKRGDTPEIEEVLKDGKKIKAWENYDKIWHGSGIDQHINLGERMENRLIGSHSAKFATDVATKTGMKPAHVDRLTNWVAGTVAAAFAGHTAKGAAYKDLLHELADEKESLRKDIPADIAADLGLANVLGMQTSQPAGHVETHRATAAPPRPAAATSALRDPVMVHKPERRRGSLAWLWWLLGLLVLFLIIFWCVRACGGRKRMAPMNEAVPATEQVVTDATGVAAAGVAGATATATAPSFEGVPRTLPDGTNITLYRGHLENAIKSYLDSDKFKNATDAELRSVWFEFTDIDFEHNSATELMPASKEHLAGLVKTLSAYPNLKIKIGAFGDLTGTRAANYAISEKRALNIEAALEAAGCVPANVSVEGFGKEFASISASASNNERAPDRDIAMRFTR